MYGNFDGIKHRAKLRKEVKNLRLGRLDKRKGGQTYSIKKNIFTPVSKKRLKEAKKDIKQKLKKDKKHQLKYNLILMFIVVLVASYVIGRYIIPFLF
ncbi:MAG: hypothetical protein COB12_03475 [Flavobacterium sp.]|nr:MAG: hypothetical protein COB12_03475 [Flavobacterium sp.]